MMRPFIAHKFVKLPARKVAAETAEITTFLLSAAPELTLPYIVVDIVAAAAAAIRRTTSAAKKPARPILRFFHCISPPFRFFVMYKYHTEEHPYPSIPFDASWASGQLLLRVVQLSKC